MSELFQLNLRLNGAWIKMISLAIMPGVIISIFTGDFLWLIPSFLATCSLLPYTKSHNSSTLALANALLIFALIYLVTLSNNWIYLLVLYSVLALIAGTIDNINSDLRAFTAWLMIGTIYGGEHLLHYHLTNEQIIFILALTLFSIELATVFHPRKSTPIKFEWIPLSNKKFIFNFKYLTPMVITLIICHYFNVHEPRWMLWSSLSVVYPELESAILKMKNRFIGVLIGASSGLVVGLLLPNSSIVTYVCFIMTMLSFRMFDDYFIGFLMRCFFVVLYAGNDSTSIALIRLSNVIIGGLIGMICTYGLVKIYQHNAFYQE